MSNEKVIPKPYSPPNSDDRDWRPPAIWIHQQANPQTEKKEHKDSSFSSSFKNDPTQMHILLGFLN